MYALVQRRRMNQARSAETRHAAETDFWPKLRHAPGFVSFTLVQGEDGVNTAITLFERNADAEAFRSEAEAWAKTLDAHGHQVEMRASGEVVQHLAADH